MEQLPKKVLCFGEILFRFSTDKEANWLKNNSANVYPDGAELNVATALAKWGVDTKYCTVLPYNFHYSNCLQYLKSRNINCSAIIQLNGRIGIYYIQPGGKLSNKETIYDRQHSAFAGLKTCMFNWDEVLKDVSLFHFSAITPALSEDAAAVCLEALQAAAKRGITISVDLNYNDELWKYGKLPVDIMPELMNYCDIIMGNIWAVEKLLGINEIAKNSNALKRKDYMALAENVSRKISIFFPACKIVTNTFRFLNECGTMEYYAVLFADNGIYQSHIYHALNVPDEMGSDDYFIAGMLYGFYKEYDLQTTIDYATVSAVGKFQKKTNANSQTVEEIMNTIRQKIQYSVIKD